MMQAGVLAERFAGGSARRARTDSGLRSEPMFSFACSVVSIAFFGALASACSSAHTAGTDTGTHEGHDGGGGVIHTCVGPLPAGAACDFTEPCRTYWDFWMGRCGDETWSCVSGRVEYVDHTFGCSLPDAGQDAGQDAGPPSDWCEDYVAPPAATMDECRTQSDCASGGGTCWAPGDTSGLHGGGACPMTCATDPDCSTGNVCEAFNGGVCHQCIPACTPTSCGPWEACGGDGHCRPARCESDGYACPPGSHCGPVGDELVDTHGCSLAACASDADCGCGACVEGACAFGPGRCDLPRP